MKKARYVPIKRTQVPPVVFEHLSEASFDIWMKKEKAFRCVVHDKQDSGIAYEFMTMDGRQRFKSRQQWYVADAHLSGGAR